MKIFDKHGMLLFPNPFKEEVKQSENVLIFTECFCPQGHNVIDKKANFNGLPGIIIKVASEEGEGLLALSPVYGDKSKISVDISLKSGQVVQMFCPTCSTPLPVYSHCKCDADLVALFLTKEFTYSDCIGICNRVDCYNAEIKNAGELLSITMLDAL